MPTIEEQSQIPGKNEGEIKVFRHPVGAKAYMWKQADMRWELIGDV